MGRKTGDLSLPGPSKKSEAALLGERAARTPGAHKHIAIIAAIAASLDGQTEKAAEWVARAKRSDPRLTAGDFLNSFPFARSAASETIERTLATMPLNAQEFGGFQLNVVPK